MACSVKTLIDRYIYSCWFSTVGILNEEFFKSFFIWVNFATGVIVVIVLHSQGATQSFAVFCFCTHTDDGNCSAVERPRWALIGSFGLMMVMHIALVVWIRVSTY